VSSKAGFDARALRRTSAAESFPWLARLVTLVRVGRDGVASQAKTDAEKRAMLGGADDGDLLLAAWPGEWSQDVFVVDDLMAARLAVGLPRKQAAPKAAVMQPVVSAPTASVDRPTYVAPGRLWQCLAELPALPAEGQRQLAARFADRGPVDVAVALFRGPRLDPDPRRRLLENASPRLAAALIDDGGCTAPEVSALLDRFPTTVGVLDVALRREDTQEAVRRSIAGLSYVEAAKMWLDNSVAWSSSPRRRPELAWAVLQVVLAAEPAKPPADAGWGSDRYERSALVRSLIGQLPPARRRELLGDVEHGRLVQQALLAGTDDLDDDELVACLPEILGHSDPVPAGAEPVFLRYARRFPRLVDLAGDRLRQAAAQLVVDGWSPVEAARSGHWDALVTAARLADDPGLVESLVPAAVFDRPAPPGEVTAAARWRDPRRYEFVDLLVGNTQISQDRLRYLLDRLTVEHIEELRESARKRSRLDRLCRQALAARRPAQAPSAVSAHGVRPQPAPRLPTDEELSAVADPTAVLRDLLRDRSQHRGVVVDHALDSAYMTDELAWRLPVQELERHPVYGPRLAAEVAAICGESAGRWQAFTRSWAQPTQLLATTLFKRLEEADLSG
jgi:hypothetical protein